MTCQFSLQKKKNLNLFLAISEGKEQLFWKTPGYLYLLGPQLGFSEISPFQELCGQQWEDG